MPIDLVGWDGVGRDNDQRLKQSIDLVYAVWSIWRSENQGVSPSIVDLMAASCKMEVIYLFDAK